jgi:hypothetical protein
MKLDQVSKDLIAGARFIERHGFAMALNNPLTAVARTLQFRDEGLYGFFRSDEHRARYHAAAERLMDACGLDNMDLSPEEAIDSLVAAAFWEVA